MKAQLTVTFTVESVDTGMQVQLALLDFVKRSHLQGHAFTMDNDVDREVTQHLNVVLTNGGATISGTTITKVK